jgi:hypothetical protein
MLTVIRLRIMFSNVAESPASCRISNSPVKLCPKWITPQTWPFLPASRASDTLSYGTYTMRKKFVYPYPLSLARRENKNDLNDVILDKAKVATAEHGISAVRCVAGADSALARIQFVVDNGQLEASRVMSESQTKYSCLKRGQ